MADDIVYFLNPDGSKVSNDPRWAGEQARKAREEELASRENTGKAVPPADEISAQLGAGSQLANLQSGQPGVGENAVPEDPSELNPNPVYKTPGQLMGEARQQQLKEGAEGIVPERSEPENEDANERVLAVREARRKRMEKAQEAQEDLGDEGPGDPEQPYSEWSGKQLKAEVLRRNADRDNEELRIDTKGVKTKAALAEKLEEDDRRQSGAATTTAPEGQGNSSNNE